MSPAAMKKAYDLDIIVVSRPSSAGHRGSDPNLSSFRA